MKEGLKSFSSFQVAAYRLSIAGVFFIPVLFKSLKKVQKKDLGILLLSGLTGSGVPAFLFTYAQLHINSSTAGALNALTPVFTLLIGVMFLGVVLSINKLAGVILGLSGALLLIVFNPKGAIINLEIHGIFIILATFMYGINVNLIKHKLSHYNAWTVASLPILFILPVALSILIGTGFFHQLNVNHSQIAKSLAAISILGMVGTALSLVMFNKLIQMTNAVFASSVTYLIPVFALMWGLIDNEPVGLIQIGGLILILLGIGLIRKQ